MELPKSLLNKKINIHFSNGKILSGTIDNCCEGYYQIEIMDDPTQTGARSGHFPPALIKECGENFVKVSFSSP